MLKMQDFAELFLSDDYLDGNNIHAYLGGYFNNISSTEEILKSSNFEPSFVWTWPIQKC